MKVYLSIARIRPKEQYENDLILETRPQNWLPLYMNALNVFGRTNMKLPPNRNALLIHTHRLHGQKYKPTVACDSVGKKKDVSCLKTLP